MLIVNKNWWICKFKVQSLKKSQPSSFNFTNRICFYWSTGGPEATKTCISTSFYRLYVNQPTLIKSSAVTSVATRVPAHRTSHLVQVTRVKANYWCGHVTLLGWRDVKLLFRLKVLCNRSSGCTALSGFCLCVGGTQLILASSLCLHVWLGAHEFTLLLHGHLTLYFRILHTKKGIFHHYHSYMYSKKKKKKTDGWTVNIVSMFFLL